MLNVNQIAAIDVGNGKTNYKAGNGVTGEFSSLAVPYKESASTGGLSVKPFTIGKKKYIVGDAANNFGAKSRSTDTSYYDSEEYKVCLLYALSLIDIKNPVLVLGLPAEWVNQKKEDLENNARKWLTQEGYHPERILVLPQQMGAFFDPNLLDEHGNPPVRDMLSIGKVGVIDIGQGTIDSCEFDEGKPTSKWFGEAYGISDIHKEVLTLLQHPEKMLKPSEIKALGIPKGFELDSATNEFTIDTWMRRGYFMYEGEKIDIMKISEKARAEFAKKYITRVVEHMWKNTKFLSSVIVSGGGSKVLGYDIIKTTIDCPILIPENPGMSNVNGFFAMAKRAINKK